VKASDFYRLNTSNEERLRINRLELFDEYEPWHLKCSHYTLISATKGAFCTQIAQEAYSKFKPDAVDVYRQLLNTPCVEKSDSNIIKINFFPIKFGIRFGHSMSAINSKIFVFGGFGENATDKSGKHLRLSAIEVVDLEKMTLDVIEPVNKTIADRMFHCSSTWSINNAENPAIFVSLGRSNPSKLFDSIVKLSIKDHNVDSLKEDDILMEKIEPKMDPDETNSNLCRFRHSTCVSNDSRLFVYGGKYFDAVTNETHALNDCYVLDATLSFLKKINVGLVLLFN
jgi:tRNA wybutosine-synthesizing protein 4